MESSYWRINTKFISCSIQVSEGDRRGSMPRLLNAKAKGGRIERKFRKWLEAQENKPYYVIKAGGSLGMWDLIAFYTEWVHFYQVKANRMPGREERYTLMNFCNSAPWYCSGWIVVWKDRKKEPDIYSADGGDETPEA